MGVRWAVQIPQLRVFGFPAGRVVLLPGPECSAQLSLSEAQSAGAGCPAARVAGKLPRLCVSPRHFNLGALPRRAKRYEPRARQLSGCKSHCPSATGPPFTPTKWLGFALHCGSYIFTNILSVWTSSGGGSICPRVGGR